MSDMEKKSTWEQIQTLYNAGKISWAVSLAEQGLLGEKYSSLSDDEKEMVHKALYDGALSVKTEDEFFEKINDVLSYEMEKGS